MTLDLLSADITARVFGAVIARCEIRWNSKLGQSNRDWQCRPDTVIGAIAAILFHLRVYDTQKTIAIWNFLEHEKRLIIGQNDSPNRPMFLEQTLLVSLFVLSGRVRLRKAALDRRWLPQRNSSTLDDRSRLKNIQIAIIRLLWVAFQRRWSFE